MEIKVGHPESHAGPTQTVNLLLLSLSHSRGSKSQTMFMPQEATLDTQCYFPKKEQRIQRPSDLMTEATSIAAKLW